MSIPADRRTTRQRPCPACAHPQRGRTGFCFFLPGHEAVWCANQATHNGAAGIPRKGGWVHRLTSAPRAAYVPTRPTAPAPAAPRPDFNRLARAYAKALTPGRLEHLAGKLGLRGDVLTRFRVGWAAATEHVTADGELVHVMAGTDTPVSGEGAWTFPMFNAAGDCVSIRVRTVRGDKYSVRNPIDGAGLFVPTGLQAARRGVLFAAEGATSPAALCQLGYHAIGRPNNRAGVPHLRALCQDLRPRLLVIVGENDERYNAALGRSEWPGLEGAEATAAALRPLIPDTRVMLPPPGVKDVRDWLRAGATAADVWRQLPAPHTTQRRLTA